MLTLEEVMSQLERIVATRRSYLLTGDKRDLESYDAAVTCIHTKVVGLAVTAPTPTRHSSQSGLRQLHQY